MDDRTTATLRDLLAMEDEVGVITVSAGFAPSTFADGLTGPDEVRANLRKLAQGHEAREQVQERLAQLDDRIAQLLDPKGEGRGRYLAATVVGGEVIEHRLQVAMPPFAAFDDGPVLRHLLEVLDEHEPAAALLLHANEATLMEVSYAGHGELQEWETRVGEIVLGDDNSGPGSSVAPGGVSHKEQQQDRVRENQDRFLRELAGEVRSTLEERGLKRLVLVGQAHERNLVTDTLGSSNSLRLLQVDRVASGDLRETLDEVEATLHEEHSAHEEDLVRAARDRAKADGAGALGPQHVTEALVAGRVDHLLLAPELELSGFVADEGGLVLDEDDPRVADTDPEPRFVHRMIERALATDSDVTPVDGPAAALLEELGGVAALLRW